MTNTKLRFGVLSTADIGNKVIAIMNQSDHAQPVAVASRELSKAQKFAEKHKIPKAYGSYEELLADPEVDAVYVPLPTALRSEWVVKAAQAKKHVLAEKPFASVSDLKTMVNACQENGVHFMDNTMWIHHDRTKKIKNDHLENGFILNRVSNNFSFFNENAQDIRYNTKLEPMGALGDLGWYCTYNILWAFNFELPTSVWGRAVFDPESGSIIDCTAELFFSKNRSANFNCSFINVSRQTTELVSTKEWIRVDGYVLPQENEPYLWKRDEYEPRAKYTVTDGLGNAKVIQLDACNQVLNLFKQFANDCSSENITSARKWSENSINVTKVLQSIFESVNEDGRTVFLSGMATPKDVIMVSQ